MNLTKKEIELTNLIEAYAKAYENLEQFQRENNTIIPIGDQKTGCIGEFIGKKILVRELNLNSDEKLEFLGHSNKGRDVKHKNNFYQIKTISAFNKSQRTSKLRHDNTKNSGISISGILIILLNNKSNLLEGSYYLLEDKTLLKELSGKTISTTFLANLKRENIKKFSFKSNFEFFTEENPTKS